MIEKKLENMTPTEMMLEIRWHRMLAKRKREHRLAKRLKARIIEAEKTRQIFKGNVIPLYWRDEFTGLCNRAERKAQYVLFNSEDDGAA
jgi:hypothetical protein